VHLLSTGDWGDIAVLKGPGCVVSPFSVLLGCFSFRCVWRSRMNKVKFDKRQCHSIQHKAIFLWQEQDTWLCPGTYEVQYSIECNKDSVAEQARRIPRSSFPRNREETATMQTELTGPLDGPKQALHNNLSPVNYFLLLSCISRAGIA
jgi:hypothetical protein